MKIWIDGYEANVSQRLGSGQVAFELLLNLEKIDKINDYTIVLPSQPLADLPQPRAGWKYKVLPFRKPWTSVILPAALYLTKQKPDLIFSPTHYIPRISPVKRVGTIFDLSYLHFPQMFPKNDLWKLTNWSKYSIEHVEHLITISQFSKKEILKNYKITKDKVTVAYPGYGNKVFGQVSDRENIAKVRAKYKISEKYLIYVGTIQPRKNLVRLIEAFAQVVKDDNLTDLQLVLVGKTTGPGRQGWMFEEILNKPGELGIENKVIFPGFVPNEDLVYLINGAIAFVLPSLYEGFGITAVDSMACGTPVIASNVSSLPEILGDAGLLIDPYSIEQISQSIRSVVTDKKLRIRKSRLGLQQAKKFSWEKMAKTVLRVFNNLK